MYTTAKSGEVWKTVSHKGNLTVKFLNDVDLMADTFVRAEIVNGTAKYLSMENRMAQRAFGKGTPGHVINMRTTLMTLVERVS